MNSKVAAATSHKYSMVFATGYEMAFSSKGLIKPKGPTRASMMHGVEAGLISICILRLDPGRVCVTPKRSKNPVTNPFLVWSKALPLYKDGCASPNRDMKKPCMVIYNWYSRCIPATGKTLTSELLSVWKAVNYVILSQSFSSLTRSRERLGWCQICRPQGQSESGAIRLKV